MEEVYMQDFRMYNNSNNKGLINKYMRRTSRIRTQINSMSKNKPFQSSIVSVIVDRCQKLTHQIQKNNTKSAALLITNLNKDLILLHHSHPSYSRIHSLVYNTKAAYYRRIGDCQQALKYIDQAISVEKTGNVDVIDMARTLLNKSVLMGQMARQQVGSKNDRLNVSRSFNISAMTFPRQNSLAIIDQNMSESPQKSKKGSINNLYSHQAAISLAKQALQMIKNRPEGKQLVQKDQYKLGQLIIISFHNIATEMICLNNKKQAQNLFKKAYDISLRIMGPRHNLTQHLKNILTKAKQQKKNHKSKSTKDQQSLPKKSKRRGRNLHRVLTQQNSMTNDIKFQQLDEQRQKSMPKAIPIVIKQNQHRGSRKKCTPQMNATLNKISSNKKYKSFIKAYGGNHKKTDRIMTQQAVQMKQLQKLKKIYHPSQTQTKYLPNISRKKIKDIITQDPVKPGYLQNRGKKNLISSTEVIDPTFKSNKKLLNSKSNEKMKTKNPKQNQQRNNQQMGQQPIIVENTDNDHIRHTETIEDDKGCQLI